MQAFRTGQSRLCGFIISLPVVLFFAGCSGQPGDGWGDDGGPSDGWGDGGSSDGAGEVLTTRQVGRDGATLTVSRADSELFGLELRFAPETFSSPTTVSVLATARPENLSDAGFDVGSSFEVSVKSGEQPLQPVEMVIPLAASGFDEGHALFVMTSNDGVGWEALPTVFNDDSQTIHAIASHFSKFSLARVLYGIFFPPRSYTWKWKRDPTPSVELFSQPSEEEIDRAISDAFAVWERYLGDIGIVFRKSDTEAADFTIHWLTEENCPYLGNSSSTFASFKKDITLCWRQVSTYWDIRATVTHEIGHHLLGIGHLNAYGCEYLQLAGIGECKPGPPVMNATMGVTHLYDDLWPEDYQWLRNNYALPHTAPFIHTRFHIDLEPVQAAPGTDTVTVFPGSEVGIHVGAFDPQGTDVSLGISQVSGIDLSLNLSRPEEYLGKAMQLIAFTAPKVDTPSSAVIEITAGSEGLLSRKPITVRLQPGGEDEDSDGDGTPDDEDGCPDDPDKTRPGDCGCGKPETAGCGEDEDGTAWTLRATAGPSPRESHAMAYDSARGVTVLFGGIDGDLADGPSLNGETWEWDGTAWTRRATVGPSPRRSHAMAYDSARGVTVLFGGMDDGSLKGDTWEWDGWAP